MIYGLYLSANGLITQGMRADVIANNLANSSTHGFKRDFLALRQRDPEVIRNGGVTPETQRHLLAIGGAVEGDRTHSIHKQGILKKTGNPLDLAIEGQGFFKYGDPDGNVYYSRAGALLLDNDNFLVGSNGFRILTPDDEPLQIEDAENGFTIDQTGRIMIEGDEAGQIAVVMPEQIEQLHKIGENLYELREGGAQAVDSHVISGHLENSAVSPIQEMTSMIQAHRAYQANAKAIGIQDETLGKAVNRIAT